jgi:DNA-binding SARP family transcriptional activator/tetratricopeptide (TPR) repeat protein
VRVTLLGPVVADVDGAVVALGGSRQRAVFAILALNVGRVVSLDHLVRVLWEDDPPAQATMALQSLVSRLRRVLLLQGGEGVERPQILTRAPGWVLELDPDAIDVTRFRSGIEEGRRLLTRKPTAAALALRNALDLWPGPALEELEIARFAREDAVALEQAHLDGCELLFTAELACGSTQVVAEAARRFVTNNPYREGAWASLCLALYRSGRQADALAAAAELRTTLADGLGLDPSPQMKELEHRILVHDAILDVARAGVVEAATEVLVSPHLSQDASPPSGGALHSAPSGPIVGRQEVLAILDEVVAQAAQGRGRAVVIQGSAGIGKSTILRTLEACEATYGGIAVHGAGVADSPAFWPWVVAVRELLSKVPDLVKPSSMSALATIDPAMFESPDGLVAAGDALLGRTRLYRAAIDLMISARRRGPLAIVLDDVQALDEETAALLSVAVPELTAHGVLFVLAFRTDDSGSDDTARRLLDRVARDSVVRVTLTNLTRDQVAETIGVLTRAAPDPAVSQAIWVRSRGNPLFVTELVRLLVSEDRLDSDGVYSALPSEVREVLRRRLERLPPATVSLLVVLALVGRPTDVALLSRITDTDEDDVLDGCEIAVLAGLLVDDPQMPGSYTLSHDLVRQTLIETVAPARKVRLHARIARALDEAPSRSSDNVVEVARHALLAAPVIGAATALPFLVAAADEALSRLALSQAEQNLVDVLTLAAQLTSAEDRAGFELQARSRLAIARIYAKGPTSIAEDAILAAAVSGSPVTLDEDDPTAWFASMTAAVAMGAYQRMVDESTRALRPDLPMSLEAMVRLELGLAHFELGHLAEAERELATTRELVTRGGSLGTLVFALSGPAVQVLLGVIAHFHGDEERADAMMAEAASLADEPASLVVAHFGRSWLAAYRGDAIAAAAGAKACAEVGVGYPAYVAMSGMLAGWADAVRGDAAGVVRADEAFADYSDDGTLLHVPLFMVLRAEAHLCAGDPPGARLLVEQARSVAHKTGEDCLGPRLSALADEVEAGTI